MRHVATTCTVLDILDYSRMPWMKKKKRIRKKKKKKKKKKRRKKRILVDLDEWKGRKEKNPYRSLHVSIDGKEKKGEKRGVRKRGKARKSFSSFHKEREREKKRHRMDTFFH